MGKTIGGVLLCLIALFMGVGFLQVGALSWASLLALVIGAGIPGGLGLTLLVRQFREPRRVAAREALRRQTIDSELVRLAGELGGKLTVVEVVARLALPAEEAGAALDELARSGVCEIQVSDSGVLVYDFADLRHLGEKEQARGLLDG
ncbi:MAG TPA: hypothetical protein VLA09_07740 [Longimicrobiales bacterium]|nr:hypothetical protein [Longimicrobiales bacterium]